MVSLVRVNLSDTEASSKSENVFPNISSKLPLAVAGANRCFDCPRVMVGLVVGARVVASTVGRDFESAEATVFLAVDGGGRSWFLPGNDGGSVSNAASFLALVAEDYCTRTPTTEASLLGTGVGSCLTGG